MKKLTALTLAAALCLSLTACGKGPKEEAVELHVFAAASLTESMTAIAESYQSVAPNVTIVCNFDSSGTLKTQIEEGAACDLFLSAAQKQMNELGEGGYLEEDTRVDLLENQVVLAVPQGNPAGVASFEDIVTGKVSLVALGNADVPVGQYSQELFTAMGLWDQVSGKATFGSNVKEVTTWVGDGVVDCGVVYATDARSAGLEAVAVADPALLSSQVVYPAAVLKNSPHAQAAKDFLTYLQGEDASAAFEAVGFSMAQ